MFGDVQKEDRDDVLLWVLCLERLEGACASTPADGLLRRLAERVAASICVFVCMCIIREYEDMASTGSDS